MTKSILRGIFLLVEHLYKEVAMATVKRVYHGTSLVGEKVVVHDKWWTRANAWTISGMLAITLYLYQAFTQTYPSLAPLVFLYGAGLSDLIDGLSAKKHSAHSWQGALLDPIRDRFAMVAILADMMRVGQPENFFFALPFCLLVTFEAFIGVKNLWLGAEAKVHLLGKLRQITHIVCGTIFLCQTYFTWWPIKPIAIPMLLWLMFIGTLIAFVSYAKLWGQKRIDAEQAPFK